MFSFYILFYTIYYFPRAFAYFLTFAVVLCSKVSTTDSSKNLLFLKYVKSCCYVYIVLRKHSVNGVNVIYHRSGDSNC